jgi:protein-disulfide isomerase
MAMDNFSPQYTLPKKHWHARWWGILLLIFLGIVFAAVFAFLFLTADIFLQIRRGTYNQQSPVNTPAVTKDNLDSATAPYLGNSQAKIVIVEFGDFACPYCQQAALVMQQLSRIFPQDLKIVFRNFPVVKEESFLAAQAGACAWEQGNFVFWALHDQLFANQDKLTEETIKNLAQNLGIDMSRFTPCLQNQKYADKIKDDATVASQAGVKKTPTFFINGEKIEGFQPLENWQAAINYLLQTQKPNP